MGSEQRVSSSLSHFFKIILPFAGVFLTLCLTAQPAYIFVQKGREKWEKGDRNGALADFNLALQKEPKHFESLLTRGRFYAESGKKDLALADWAKALQVKPGNVEVLLLRAELYQKNKEEVKALDDLNLAVKSGADGVIAYERRAMLRLQSGENEKAEADFDQAIKSSKISAVGWRHAGVLKQKKNEHLVASGYFQEALKLDAQDLPSYFLLAKSLLAMGGSEEAKNGLFQLAEFEKRGGSKDVEFYKTRYFLLKEAGDNTKAKEDLSMLLDKLKVKDTALMEERANGEGADALKQINKILSADRDNKEMLLKRAGIYFKQGKTKFPLAVADLKRLTDLSPDNAEVWKLLTLIHVQEVKWEKALEASNAWVKLHPEAEAYYLRSKCHFKLNNLKLCCADLDKAASLGHSEARKDKAVVCR